MPRKSEPDETDIDPPPTEINPYEILSIDPTADQNQIKTAYRKAALKHHPDKAGPTPTEKSAANTKFQEIAFAYAILSDERRRNRYDATGRTEESLDIDDDDFDWLSFYREQFTEVVTNERIEQFSKEYKGSEEERKAVLEAYSKYKGDMDKVYQVVMLSDAADDELRFRVLIGEAIEKGEVHGYEKFVDEPKKKWEERIEMARKRREEPSGEVQEVKEMMEKRMKGRKGGSKKGGGNQSSGGMGDLAALIANKNRGRQDAFMDRLEAKYGGGEKRAAMEEPSEEAFAANRKKSKKA